MSDEVICGVVDLSVVDEVLRLSVSSGAVALIVMLSIECKDVCFGCDDSKVREAKVGRIQWLLIVRKESEYVRMKREKYGIMTVSTVRARGRA